MQSCFCVSRFMFVKHTKRQPGARDAPTYDTQVMMVTTIQLKLIRSRGGGGGTIADKDEDKDVEKDMDENNNLMKDNSV